MPRGSRRASLPERRILAPGFSALWADSNDEPLGLEIGCVRAPPHDSERVSDQSWYSFPRRTGSHRAHECRWALVLHRELAGPAWVSRESIAEGPAGLVFSYQVGNPFVLLPATKCEPCLRLKRRRFRNWSLTWERVLRWPIYPRTSLSTAKDLTNPGRSICPCAARMDFE